jgi:general secretion pathway protein I
MRTGAGRTRQAGFTLLEVLVALVIMAFSLGALYHSLVTSVQVVGEMARVAEGGMIARSLLEGRAYAPRDGLNEQGGRDDGLIWSIRSSPYQGSAEGTVILPLQRVEVVVGWRGSERSIRLVTLLPEQDPAMEAR